MPQAIRAPLQSRSRRSLEKVLAAGVEILLKSGYDALSIDDVSALAGVSVGSIYARFASKSALFTALQERLLAGIDEAQATLFAHAPKGATDVEVVDRAVLRLAEHFRRHEAALRVMILRGAADAVTRERGSRSSAALAALFEAHLLAHVGAFAHANPPLAVDVCFRVVYASLTRRIMSGPRFESRRAMAWRIYVRELSHMCRTYLLGSGVASPHAGRPTSRRNRRTNRSGRKR
jgi:AcrR family transcriptional regulator